MSTIVAGTATAIEQPLTYGYTVGKGDYTRRRWIVSAAAEVLTLTATLRQSGYSFDVSPIDNGAATLVEARIEAEQSDPAPSATILSEVWEREAQVSDKDILESDVSVISDLTQAEKLIIQKELSNPNPSFTSTGLSADAVKVFKLMLSGVKTVRVYAPVIRRTRLAANNYSVVYADSNVGRVLSGAQMVSFEGTPGTLLFNLPSYTTARDSTEDTAMGGLRYGFLKKPARITQQGDGRWQIVQEYDYDLWSSLIYSNAS